MIYNINKAVEYAHKWAYGRNPSYYDFNKIGGYCTNFISQCLYAGCGKMNYTRDVGWYYNSPQNRAAAWSGVEYLYKFLTNNKGAGPYATEMPIDNAEAGDIIQLSFDDGDAFAHSLFVVDANPDVLVATHTEDSDNRPLNSYNYQLVRLIHIVGVR